MWGFDQADQANSIICTDLANQEDKQDQEANAAP
jgi:hypothetical protein